MTALVSIWAQFGLRIAGPVECYGGNRTTQVGLGSAKRLGSAGKNQLFQRDNLSLTGCPEAVECWPESRQARSSAG